MRFFPVKTKSKIIQKTNVIPFEKKPPKKPDLKPVKTKALHFNKHVYVFKNNYFQIA